MRIAVVAPSAYPVPPHGYGGTERVISLLVEGLVCRGHAVTLFASGDSQTTATLSSSYPQALGAHYMTWADQACHASQAFLDPSQFDVIHNHTSLSGLLYSLFVNTPTLHTIHYFEEETSDPAFYREWPAQQLVVISQSQRALLAHPDPVWVVYNGVDFDTIPLCQDKHDYLLHIGRLSEWKGTHLAVEVARRTGRRLILAGKIENAAFWKRQIAPHIDGEQIQFRGVVGGAERLMLFQHASALLFPVQWSEPFGLVLVEALACGTPVICFDRGSVPEIVTPGRSGWIVADVDEMCTALGQLDHLDPAMCRAMVEQRFSAVHMVEQYERIYETLVAQQERSAR